MKAKKLIALAAALTLPLTALPKASAAVKDVQSYKTLLGDVNTDTTVNVKDVLSLIPYLLDESISKLNSDLDCNCDGEIELTDLAALKQFVAKDPIRLQNKARTMRNQQKYINIL